MKTYLTQEGVEVSGDGLEHLRPADQSRAVSRDASDTALKQSIEKWERNAVAETPDGYGTGPKDCALCDLFFSEDCYGCPVNAKTRRTNCLGTPYSVAEKARDDWASDPYRNALRAAAHAAARDEVDFLRSLLPEVNDGDFYSTQGDHQ